MNRICRAFALSSLALCLTGGVSFAQAQDHHDNHQYVRHTEWKHGAHIRQEDWARGEQIDYRQHHLKPPPRGYEWREIDGNFVLAASNGVISTVVVAH